MATRARSPSRFSSSRGSAVSGRSSHASAPSAASTVGTSFDWRNGAKVSTVHDGHPRQGPAARTSAIPGAALPILGDADQQRGELLLLPGQPPVEAILAGGTQPALPVRKRPSQPPALEERIQPVLPAPVEVFEDRDTWLSAAFGVLLEHLHRRRQDSLIRSSRAGGWSLLRGKAGWVPRPRMAYHRWAAAPAAAAARGAAGPHRRGWTAQRLE